MDTISREAYRILPLLLHVHSMPRFTISLQFLSSPRRLRSDPSKNGIEEEAQNVANILLRERLWIY